MRKILYVEPEMEVYRFGSKSDVRTVNDNLAVSKTPDGEGGDFDGDGDLWGDIY